MKKFISYLMLAAVAVSNVACDDDDDDKKQLAQPVTAAEISGIYAGSQFTTVTVYGAEVQVPMAQNVRAVITDNADGTLNVTIHDFTYQDVNYGNIVLQNAVIDRLVDDDTGDTEFHGTGTCTLTKDGTDYTATITDLEGDYNAKNSTVRIEIDMTLPVSPAMSLEFDIDYEGTKILTE